MERQTDRDRQTKRLTDRQTDWKDTKIQAVERDRQTGEKERETERDRERTSKAEN